MNLFYMVYKNLLTTDFPSSIAPFPPNRLIVVPTQPRSQEPRGCTPELNRPARAAACALAAGLALLLAASAAQAQTTSPGKLVSKTGQTRSSQVTFEKDYLQRFTTGNTSAGYLLTKLDLQLEIGGMTTPTYTVTIHGSIGGALGNLLGTLDKPTSLATGINSFTAPGAGIRLAPSTDYWVLIDLSSGGTASDWKLDFTDSDDEDSGSASGWSINDDSTSRNLDNTGPVLVQASWMMAVHGQLWPPGVTGATVNGTALTLTYGRGLDTSSTPAAGDYTVKVGGTGRGLAGTNPVVVSGSTVTLTLATAVTHTDTVTVSYTAGTNPIKDEAFGVDALNLTDQAVTNKTPNPLGISEVAIASDPGAGNAYAIGEPIQVQVTFNQAMNVTGTPRLKIKFDPDFGEQWAEYASGSGTSALTFAYTPVSGNISTQGIAVLANTLQLNGGTITAAADGTLSAVLTHVGLPHDANHLVETTVPTLTWAAVYGTKLTLTYSEDLDEDSQPAGSAFAVTPASQSAIQGTGTATVAGATATVTLASAAPSNTASTLAYTKPASGALRDVAGNEAAGLSSEAAVNYTGLDAGNRLLLGNTGQSIGSVTRDFGNDFAQGISVGAGTKGFRVTEAKVRLNVSGTPTNLTYSAAIYTHNASNDPGTLVGTFDNNPASLSIGSNNTFTAPRGIDLARDGGFSWLVLDIASIQNPGSVNVPYISGSNVDSGSIPDSTVTAQSRFRSLGSTNWQNHSAPMGVQLSGREDGPDLSSVAVNGTAVTLTYARALDTGSTPAGSDFTVNVAGTDVTLAATNPVTVSGSAVTLTLASAVTAGQAVTVTYTAATNPIQDTDGVDADNLADLMVVNNLSDPVVTGVAITSDPGAGIPYGTGDFIQVTVTFNLAVNVDETGGTPRLKIKMDPGFGDKWADYDGGSGSNALIFSYEVVSPNASPQGIAVLANTLQLNGGTIKSTAMPPVDAALGHVGLGHDPNHRVDTTPPTLLRAGVRRNQLVLTFTDALDSDSQPAGSACSVTATPTGGSARSISGTGTATVAGTQATVALVSAANQGEAVTTDYTKPASDPLQDTSGNDVATYSGQAAVNYTGQDSDTSRKLLQNKDRTPSANAGLENDRAQTFTTGPSTTGWVITEVQLRFIASPGNQTATYSLSIWDDNEGVPGTLLATLDNPASLATGMNIFTAPGRGIALGGSSLYWLVLDIDSVDNPNNRQLRLTDDENEDSGGSPGGSVGNSSFFRSNSVTSWDSATSIARSWMLIINGRAAGPQLSAASVSGTGLTLAFNRALDTGSTPAAGDFSVEVAGSTVALAATDPVEVSGSAVTLNLTSAVTAGQRVEVTYTRGTNPVQDVEGIDAEDFSGREVTNNQVSLTPAVSGVAITSNPGADGAYTAGDTIQVGLTFDRAVNVTGTPRLQIKMDPGFGEKWANYASGDGTANLTFSYTVVSGNNSPRGIAVLQDTLELNGGTIKSTLSSAEDANLAHTGLAHDANHLVDTSEPQLAFAAVNGATLVLTFDEDLDEASQPAGSAFTVTATPSGGQARTIQGKDTATVDGATATVALASAASQGETLTVAYAKPASGPLRDVFGSEVATFSGRSAANNTGQAQTSVNLVSNTGQATGRSFLNFNHDVALGFTTGSATDGYTLTSVQIAFDAGTVPSVQYEVRINNATAGGGVGGTSLGTLENPAGLVDGLNLFEASGTGIELDASTSYFVFIDFTAHGTGGLVHNVLLTLSDDEDSGGAAGWSLSDSAVERLSPTDPWTDVSQGNPVRLSIQGFMQGAPALSSTTVSGAAVTLTYDRALDTTSTPAAGDFTVKVNGNVVSLAATNPVVVSGSAVTLNLASAVTAGQTVTVTYTPGTNPIRSSGGTDAGSLADQALENDTPPPPVDPPPVNPPPVNPPPVNPPPVNEIGTVPGAPRNLSAVGGNGQVVLSWSAPENDGGSPIQRYEYRVRDGREDFGEWTPIPDSAADAVNASGYTVGDLLNGTVYVVELRAVNAAGNSQKSDAVEVTMPLDPAFWSNFRAEDLEEMELTLEAFLLEGSSRDRELRFGEGLRFEQDELDGEGEVTATRSGSHGYRYTSRTTGELSLEFDDGEACELRLTFSGEGAGSYSYRCGGSSRGQGSFELSELNREPEITSAGPFQVEENTTRVGQLEAVDWDEEDEVTGYEVAGGADGALFAVDGQTGELSFREAPDYENPGDVESTEPRSEAGDNEYILVVEVTSGEGARVRTREQAIRVWVTDVKMEEAVEEKTESLFVPVILSSAGRNRSFFTSELTLTNRGEQEVRLDYTYTSKDEPDKRSGTASDVLPAGRQKIEGDALDYLRNLGIPIPGTGNQLGTLRVEAPLGSEVEAVVRTSTLVTDGRAGLAYLGVAEEDGFTEPVYLCGLRQNSQDRSNVAFQNMGAAGEGAITLKTTVYSGEASDTSPRELDDVTLEPGGFHQFSGLLGGLENGYVKVERVEGEAPFCAYGVINDQANSDGSFVFPVTAGSLEGKMAQTLPVIVETSEFTSELTATNFSEEPRTLEFEFVGEQVKTDDKTAAFSMELEGGEQAIVPEVVEELRLQGVAGLGTGRGFYLGPLFVVAEEGDLSGIVIGARTGSKGGGGQYSVFYTAAPEGEAFSQEAWVEGLQQNEENRSNLALVNTGEVDGSESVFHLEIYNGETGMLEETVVTKPIPARGWHQINGILLRASSETRQGYVRIEKVSGENPFLAYGVVNDGGSPGERSGDGAYLPARQ